MSKQPNEDRLDKIIKRLDIITVILLAQSGLTRTEIASALGVSEKTIGRLIPVSKIKGKKGKRSEIETAPVVENSSPNV
jgi:DNA-binding NarL/FixJ family response regulator